ncbi:hypothetical protein Cni_G19932 [Canna indica]|uniref:Uncharacterized protein n=1 Tax=Canna indica TaxID=4628 RepID=A0AAQ3KSA3_9LILI|nr:hypothetical protein Cni_G19932 [Canna indica]
MTLQWSDFDSCRVQVRVRAIEDIPDFILADAEDYRFEIKVVVAWQQPFYQHDQAPAVPLPPPPSDGNNGNAMEEAEPDHDPAVEELAEDVSNAPNLSGYCTAGFGRHRTRLSADSSSPAASLSSSSQRMVWRVKRPLKIAGIHHSSTGDMAASV